jgi:hypothetical protein
MGQGARTIAGGNAITSVWAAAPGLAQAVVPVERNSHRGHSSVIPPAVVGPKLCRLGRTRYLTWPTRTALARSHRTVGTQLLKQQVRVQRPAPAPWGNGAAAPSACLRPASLRRQSQPALVATQGDAAASPRHSYATAGSRCRPARGMIGYMPDASVRLRPIEEADLDTPTAVDTDPSCPTAHRPGSSAGAPTRPASLRAAAWRSAPCCSPSTG